MQITLDMVQANRELTDLARSLGLALRDLMYDQARLLAQDAVRRVRPGGPKEGPAAQKKAGIKAISDDLSRIIVPFGEGASTSMLKDMQQQGLIAGDSSKVFKTKSGAVYGVENDFVKMTASNKELEKFHNSFRSSKTGRVTTAGTYTKDIGRWKFVDKMHVPDRVAQRFLRHKIKKVGQLKAGFVPAADYFASLLGNTAKAIPSWVRKQSAKMGTQINAVNQTTGVGSIVVSNMVPYAENAIPKSTQSFLEENRQRDIEKSAPKRLRAVAKKHNEKYARAA
jgi:hypothetical protein